MMIFMPRMVNVNHYLHVKKHEYIRVWSITWMSKTNLGFLLGSLALDHGETHKYDPKTLEWRSNEALF